jgi:hypothetical protein
VTQAANPTLTKLKDIANRVHSLWIRDCDGEERYEIYLDLQEVIRIVERKAFLVQKLRRKIRAMKKRNLKFKGQPND